MTSTDPFRSSEIRYRQERIAQQAAAARSVRRAGRVSRARKLFAPRPRYVVPAVGARG